MMLLRRCSLGALLALLPTQALAGPLLVGAEAWTYGYPILLMDETMDKATGEQRICGFDADVNTFRHLFEIPDENFLAVVRPNVDTLYSSAFLDLSMGPQLLTMGKTDDRYVLLALFDAWSNNFEGLGTVSHGTAGGRYLIQGPDAPVVEKLPDDITLVTAPTDMVWIIGRTEVRGPQDQLDANDIQLGLTLSPWHGSVQPTPQVQCIEPDATDEDGEPIVQTPPDAVKSLSTIEYMQRLSDLIDEQGALPLDDEKLESLATIGVGPLATFDVEDLDPLDLTKVEQGANLAQSGVEQGLEVLSVRGGWSPDPSKIDLGDYEDRYVVRAVVAEVGFGANRSDFAVYQNNDEDEDGQPLDGAFSYELTFPAGELPPVDAFWSITVYNEAGYLTGNELGRYALGTNSGLEEAADGSVTLYLAHEQPAGAPEANWLPVPDDVFQLTLRMYSPHEAILEGIWTAPDVVRVP